MNIDNISIMASRIYLAPDVIHPSAHVHVPRLGIREVMPPGMLHSGGQGSRYPYLLMYFHTPAFAADASAGLSPAAGKLIIWEYEAVHQYGHDHRTWDHSWLQLRGDLARRLIGRRDIPTNRLLPMPSPDGFLRYLSILYEELHGRSTQDADMVEGIVNLIWRELTRTLSGHVGKDDTHLEAARRHLESHYHEDFDLGRLADEACLSKSHFCWKFASRYGVPPHEYAQRLRLNRATYLLGNPNLAIYQIAEMIGYKDALYFSRVFRQRYGVSPRQYRRDLQQSIRQQPSGQL